MGLSGLEKEGLKLILFGGKGGVGKTTCAASTAVYLSNHFKTLLISTDPAHSLSDSLGVKVGSQIKEVAPLRPSGFGGQEGVRNLSALAISAEKALSEFKKEYHGQIKQILDTSTYLDDSDIDSILSLSIPGIDEVMGFKTILELIESAEFEKYVVDTAPTGHALRLLSLPGLLDEWIKVLAQMRWKYRYMVESFGGKFAPDDSDDFLFTMKKTVNQIKKLLKNINQCEFVVVTMPEDMVINETQRLVNDLNKYGIKVRQMVINNLLESTGCEFCRQRKKAQQSYIKEIGRKFSSLNRVAVGLQPQEVKGIPILDKFKEQLFQC